MEKIKPTYKELENQVVELTTKLKNSENHPYDLLLTQSLFENPNSINIFSLDKNHCYTSFTGFHQATIKKIWGVEIQIGLNMLNIISRYDDRVKAKSNFDRALNGESFILTEEYGKEKTHRIFYDNYYYPVKNTESKIIGLLVFVLDVSFRKQIEFELIAAKEKAEASDRLKTSFINNISHEIRTPLNGILGFSSFVIQPDITMEEKRECLEILETSSNRLINTIDDIMDISLIISGNMKMNPKPIHIFSLLTNVFEQFQEPSKKKNLEIKMQSPDNADKYIIQTDEEMLQKTVSKLVDNSVKFTKNGIITLGFEFINNEIEIFVKDTGVGIEKDSHERVMEVFSQEDVSLTRGHEGSGLGLSIAKGMIQLLGGEIRLESTKNVGTTVFLTLPNITSTDSPAPK